MSDKVEFKISTVHILYKHRKGWYNVVSDTFFRIFEDEMVIASLEPFDGCICIGNINACEFEEPEYIDMIQTIQNEKNNVTYI